MSPTRCRSWARMRVSSRDTCIWVTPILSATSRWVSPSKKRSLRMSPVALAEGADGGMQHHPCLGGAMVAVVTGEQVSECRCSVVPHRQVERSRREAAVAGQRFEDGFDGHVEMFGDLCRAWGSPELEGELGLCRADSSLELLDAACRPDHPAVVPEVLPQLAADRRPGVRHEVVPGGHVVAVGGLGQRQRGDLAEVVEWHAAGAVLRRLGVRVVEVHLDHGVQQPTSFVLAGARLCRQEQLARASRTFVVRGDFELPWVFRGKQSSHAPACRSPHGDTVVVSAAGLEHPDHPVDRLQRDVLSPNNRATAPL